jgi:hypothetical protein
MQNASTASGTSLKFLACAKIDIKKEYDQIEPIKTSHLNCRNLTCSLNSVKFFIEQKKILQ